ncbi:lysozyme g1 [Rhinolophus ferrumequinum]|uniref:Lysozyme g-like protein n=1 Tax=Rhinolophus ferrumequinum TaxID=59479 RepID=A0A7J7V8E7_RHIFE|nr:lysozyme g1 [Rhinolophus ferrumequinum]
MSVLWLLVGLLALTDSCESGNWGCYGNIRTLDTPGASCGIGRRRGLNYCGRVRASERMAEIDMPYLVRYQPVIYTVGQKYCMDPAVIAGVMSRESPGGNVINMGNVGDGIRVVQDSGHHVPTSWITESQLSQMTEVLTLRIKEIQRRFPTWTPDQYLRGGLCAYGGGPGYVRSSQDLSCDFCNDVLARAKYFKRHGF